MKIRALCLVAIVSASCSGGGSNSSSLTRLTEVAASAKCASGGVQVDSGLDKNNNGALDPDEVTQSAEICNGAAGAAVDGQNGDAGLTGLSTLVLTTVLPKGDTTCPDGGVKLDFGLDDGSGGGTARNGTLEAGEITVTRYVCSGPARFFPGSTTPPAAPAGQFTANANGGNGLSGAGASGGRIRVENTWGTRGGHVKTFKTGAVDAGFTVAANPTFVAGATPMTIAADTTVGVYSSLDAGVASGDTWFLVSNQSAAFTTVAGVAVPVTSLSVAAGKTLTLGANSGESAVLLVAHDIRVAGTITTETLEDGASLGHLSLAASNFYAEAGSSVSTRGTNSSSVGGNGGNLAIAAGSLLVAQGALNASGGNGDTGAGSAGTLSLSCDVGSLTNTGTIEARGGNATTAAGGNGGSINVTGGYRTVRNSGAIDASGGNGVLGGGTAGAVELTLGGVGDLINSGNLSALGGNCSANNCQGGSGANVRLSGHGGDLRNSGNLSADGAAGQGTGQGGYAGQVIVNLDDNNSNYAGGLVYPVGSIFVSGNLSANGGSGASGRGGGNIDVRLTAYAFPQGQEITLLGYTAFNVVGGAGTNGNGGSGGEVDLLNLNDSEGGNGEAGGAVLNYVDVQARAGDGAQGGTGGMLTMQTQYGHNEVNPWEYVANFAATVDVHGGLGATLSGGGGGSIDLEGTAHCENHAAVNANGGNASGTPVIYSGSGGSVYLASSWGLVTNTGALQLSAGSSSGYGADGGGVAMQGASVNNSGAITANGGNATLTGGSGGQIAFVSTPNATSTNTGAMTVNGGSGTPAGGKGRVLLDGNDVTP